MKQLKLVYENICDEALITLKRGGTIYSAGGFWVRPRCDNGEWRAATNNSEIQRKIERHLKMRETFGDAAQDLDEFALEHGLDMVKFIGYKGAGNNRDELSPEAFAVSMLLEMNTGNDAIPWWLAMSDTAKTNALEVFTDAYRTWVVKELAMDRRRMVPTVVLNGLGEPVSLT